MELLRWHSRCLCSTHYCLILFYPTYPLYRLSIALKTAPVSRWLSSRICFCFWISTIAVCITSCLFSIFSIILNLCTYWYYVLRILLTKASSEFKLMRIGALPCRLSFSYSIRLPTGTRFGPNTTETGVGLITFYGADNWHRLSMRFGIIPRATANPSSWSHLQSAMSMQTLLLRAQLFSSIKLHMKQLGLRLLLKYIPNSAPMWWKTRLLWFNTFARSRKTIKVFPLFYR